MKINSYFFTYIISIIFLTSSLFAQENQIFKIITPSQMDVSDEGIAYLVVEAQGGLVDSFTITTDMNETFNTKVNSKRTHYCKSLALNLGENTIQVNGYKEDTLVEEQQQKIFVVSKIFKEYKYPPEEYSYSYFHKETNEKVCSKCHDMGVNEVKGVAFEDVTKSNCYQCHNTVGAKKHGHAPAVNWLCTSCHNGTVGKYNMFDANRTKYSVPDPIESLCFSCHKKNKEKWSKMRFNHEPADSGRCNKCHNPHASDNLNYLRKPAWELCTTCHQDKIEGMHIVRTFTRVMHPTHNIADPSRKGKDLSCISCHNPHFSNAPSLLQSKTVMGLCSRCHKK